MKQNSGSRRDVLAIFHAALEAADPAVAIQRRLKILETGELRAAGLPDPYPLEAYKRILAVGAGKATARMAEAIEDLLGSRISGGLINVKHGHGSAALRRIEVNECAHPTPDEAGWKGAQRIAEIARDARKDDLVLCLISGGASALLPLPAGAMTLDEKRAMTQSLLASGADIHEMNIVRKHFSAIKGGQLAAMAYPATVLTLILSDVIGDEPGTIGSGPTAPDASTAADALAVLQKYGIAVAHPPVETPKPGDALFRRVRNLVVGSNRLAMEAAKRKAVALGYNTLVLSSLIEGETREVARVHGAIAREIVASGQPLQPPACVISGGETTVTIRGDGLGGRNQEFALAAAIDIHGQPRITVASAGTDGTDGPTDAAGAIADGLTLARARALGLMSAADYLARNDSYRYFEALEDLILTGPTGTNVMDLRLIIVQ
jgi:hydroxypyruvate reductase